MEYSNENLIEFKHFDIKYNISINPSVEIEYIGIKKTRQRRFMDIIDFYEKYKDSLKLEESKDIVSQVIGKSNNEIDNAIFKHECLHAIHQFRYVLDNEFKKEK